MRFANTALLNWLLILPILMVLFDFLLSRRQKKMSKLVDQKLLDQVTYEFSLKQLRNKNYALLACVFCLIVALARPQWGFVTEKIKRKGLDIILAVDVSKSMMTQDVMPNRLERSKLAIKDLLKRINGDRLGLIAFAGQAFMICPLTTDYAGFAMSVDDLSIQSIPVGGTNIEKVIQASLRAFGNEDLKYKAVVILTDGEEEQGDALAAARQAKKKGVKIFTIGIGTKEGDLIQITQEEGRKEFVKDQDGNFVKSSLNEDLLQKIAYITGGAYVRSRGAEFGLDYLYTHELSKWAKREIEEKEEKKYHDHYQLALGLGLMFLWLSL